jgi:hypothetical protein
MATKPSRRAPLAPAHGAGHVVDWRADRLRAGGFEPEPARALASDPAVDVHALLELCDRGCPPELAVRILAPLDRHPDEPA